MKVKVSVKKVGITEYSQVNSGEKGINVCEFSLPDVFDGLSVNAVFNGETVPVVDSVCIIPPLEKGNASLGVYACLEENGVTEIIYSPEKTYFAVFEGSYNGEAGDDNGQ